VELVLEQHEPCREHDQESGRDHAPNERETGAAIRNEGVIVEVVGVGLRGIVTMDVRGLQAFLRSSSGCLHDRRFY